MSHLLLIELLACVAAPASEDSGLSSKDSATSSFPTTREAWRWPFTPDSAWNVSVGSGLVGEEGGAACTENVRDTSVNAWINAEEWSHPVFLAGPDDPIWPVWDDGEERGSVATPPAASPSLPRWPDGDAHLHLVDPEGGIVTEMWKARAESERWDVDSVAVVDLYGTGIGTDGVRIYGGSAIGGLVREGEVEAGIWHALALSLPLAALAPTAVWPATTVDSSREDDMIGAVPIGQLVFLPADTSDHIAASPAGRALVRALRDYGAYVVDHAGNFALYAEPGAEAEVEASRDDLDAIRSRLVCATNNSESEPGGPGTRAQPPAPEL